MNQLPSGLKHRRESVDVFSVTTMRMRVAAGAIQVLLSKSGLRQDIVYKDVFINITEF